MAGGSRDCYPATDPGKEVIPPGLCVADPRHIDDSVQRGRRPRREEPAPARRRREEEAAPGLWGALQSGLGNERMRQIEAEGPVDAQSLYVHHLLRIQRETGLQVQGHLPWTAPPSWAGQIAPLYRVLWHERDAAPGPHAATGSAPQIAGVPAPGQ